MPVSWNLSSTTYLQVSTKGVYTHVPHWRCLTLLALVVGHVTWHPVEVINTETCGCVVVLACRFSLIGADSLVLLVTWYQTYRMVKLFQRQADEQGERSFGSTLFYDGECSD